MKREDPVGCVGERIGYPESVHHRSDEDEVERSELGNMGLASASPSDHLTCFYHIQHIHYCIYLYYRIIRHRPYSITVYSNTGDMGRKILKFSQTRHNHYGRVAARRRPSKRNNRSGKKTLSAPKSIATGNLCTRSFAVAMLAVLTSLSAFASLLHGSEGDKRANSAETSGALQQFEMKNTS